MQIKNQDASDIASQSSPNNAKVRNASDLSSSTNNSISNEHLNTQHSQNQPNKTQDSTSQTDDVQEQIDSIERYIALAKLSSSYVKNLSALALTEFRISVLSTTKALKLQIVLAPLLLIFYISVCASVAYTFYLIFNSGIAAMISLLAFQFIVIMGIKIYVKSLKKNIGFSKTEQQFQEVKNELASKIKS